MIQIFAAIGWIFAAAAAWRLWQREKRSADSDRDALLDHVRDLYAEKMQHVTRADQSEGLLKRMADELARIGELLK